MRGIGMAEKDSVAGSLALPRLVNCSLAVNTPAPDSF